MTQTLTPGRWRGLTATSTDSQVFTILAFDQRGTYRKMLPAGASYSEATEIKRQVVMALAPHTSAVLLDAEYGLPAALALPADSGLLMALEKSGYSGDSTYRRIEFDADWTVAKIKRVGASAVKLLAYYHPDAGELAEEIEGVCRKVADECHRLDLPLFLEPISYSLKAGVAKESAEFAATLPDVVRRTAERLGACGADVLKMEFPVLAAFDSDASKWRNLCETISMASPVPWVLLSAGVDYTTFVEQARAACKAGASGFLAGRAIWKECVPMTEAERAEFLRTTAARRADELSEIAEKHARKWTDFYAPQKPIENWYRGYPA